MNRKRIPLFTLIPSLFALLASCSSSPSGPTSKNESSAQPESSSISNSSKEESKVQESSVYEPPVEESSSYFSSTERSISSSSEEESKAQESSVYEPPVEESSVYESSVEESSSYFSSTEQSVSEEKDILVTGEVFKVTEDYFSSYQYIPFYEIGSFGVRIRQEKKGAFSLSSFDNVEFTFEEGIDRSTFAYSDIRVVVFDESITEIRHFPAVSGVFVMETSSEFIGFGNVEEEPVFDRSYLYFSLICHGEQPAIGERAFYECTLLSVYHDPAHSFPRYFYGARTYTIGYEIPMPNLTMAEYSLQAAEAGNRDLKQLYDALANEGREYEYLYPWTNTLSKFEEMVDFAQETFKDASTEQEKADAVYGWIRENVLYDEFFNYVDPHDAFVNRGGVCSQYVGIMHDLLGALGVVSFYCNGVMRDVMDEIGVEYTLTGDNTSDPEFDEKIKPNFHAWIAVIIDGEVKYYDPTWGISFGNDLEALSNHVVTFFVDFHQVKPDSVDESFESVILDKRTYCLEGNYYIEGGFWRNVYLNVTTSRVCGQDTTPYIGRKQEWGTLYHDCIVGGGDVYYAREDRIRIDLSSFIQFILFLREKLHIEAALPEGVVEQNGFYLVPEFSLAVLYAGEEKEVTVPSVCGKAWITRMYGPFFPHDSKVEKVIVSEGIQTIDGYESVFSGLTELRSISLPSTLYVFVAHNALFAGSKKLGEVVVSKDNEMYRSSANNDALLSKDGTILFAAAVGEDGAFTIDPTVEDIRAKSFSFSPIRSIFIPKTVKMLANVTFSYSDLEEVVFEERDDEITFNSHVFADAHNLSKVVLPSKIFDLQYRVSGSLPSSTFVNCFHLHQIEIPEGITELANGCFASTGLVSIKIPSSLTSAAFDAFIYADNLREIVGDPNNVLFNMMPQCKKISSFAESSMREENGFLFYFDGDDSLLVEYLGNEETVTLPDIGHDYYVGGYSFFNPCPYSYAFFGGTFTLGDYEPLNTLFADKTPIKKIIIPKNVRGFYSFAFYSCLELREAQYLGTMEEWELNVKYGREWKVRAPLSSITCTNGNYYVGRFANC